MADSMDMFGDSDSDEDTSRREVVAAAVAAAGAAQNDLRPFAAVGPVSVGGGRGIIAMEDLPAGSLVVAEIPVMPFEDASQLDDPECLMIALEGVCASELAVNATEFIFPQDYSEADDEEKRNVANIWGEDRLQQLAERVQVPRDELVRRVLALQHNAFDTGLYKWLSMINHSCAPNCIKFAPSNSSGWASEIWTTRAVPKGGELTMSYRSPLETAASAMRLFLQQHHRFRCVCAACQDREREATIGHTGRGAAARARIQTQERVTVFTAAATEEGEAEAAAEATLAAIEEAAEAMEKELKWLAVDDEEDVLHTCKRMQHASEQLLERTLAVALAHPAVDAAIVTAAAAQHMQPIANDVRMYGDLAEQLWADGRNRSAVLILARVHKCYADAAALVLNPRSRTASSSGKKRRVKRSLTSRSLLLFVVNAARLAQLQRLYLGDEHPDLAGTHLDVAEGLRAAVDLYAKDSAADAPPAPADASESAAGGALESATDFIAAMRASQIVLLGLPAGAAAATSTADVLAAMREHKATGERLKALYATRRRFPDAHSTLKSAGAVYWGRPAQQRGGGAAGSSAADI